MGLIRGIARTAAVAGTATAVSNRVSRRQSERWAQQDQQDYLQSYQQPAPAQSGSDGRIAQLQDLADLKARGILTEEELEAEKARILAS